MRMRWVVVTAALVASVGCTDSQGSVFDPEEDRLCTWFTDEDVNEIIDDAIGGGETDEEIFKSSLGWGCWWQASDFGLLLAPTPESDAHPMPDDVASFPHPALSDGISVVDWPQGDWPPQIEVRTDGKGLSVLLRIEDMSQLLSFSLEIPSESEADVHVALSIADEILNLMGWVG